MELGSESYLCYVHDQISIELTGKSGIDANISESKASSNFVGFRWPEKVIEWNR